MVDNIPSSAHDSKGPTPPDIKFSEILGDLEDIDFQNNLNCFNNELPVKEAESNSQIIFICLTKQLGLENFYEHDLEGSKVPLARINRAFRAETPLEVMNNLREYEAETESRFTESFADLVTGRFDIDMPVSKFKQEILAYSVILSLTDQCIDDENADAPLFRANKELYLHGSAIEVLKNIFGTK